MARNDDNDGARRKRPPARKAAKRPPRRPTSGSGSRGYGRDRAREGGFGPWGAPRDPERERRGDDDRARPVRPSRLRIRGERPAASSDKAATRNRKAPPPRPPRRRRRPPSDIETEILRLGGERGLRLLERLLAAADAFSKDRDQEALHTLRPVRNALPDAPSVRELMGLVQYRLGNYRAASKELDAFVEITGSVEQHPVLMDCLRAQRRWGRIDDLWRELAETSPSADLVTEGRIVAAGALADRGRLPEAIAILDRKGREVRSPRSYHLRVWYALADLEERAGNLARARELFKRVRTHDPEFADVDTRIAALR